MAGSPARANPPTVVLKRGKHSSMEMWAWHEAARTGDTAARKSATLVMDDYDGKPVARYHLENALALEDRDRSLKPAKNAGSGKIAVETLELSQLETVVLVCDHIQRVSP